jgi:hypothetical protein
MRYANQMPSAAAEAASRLRLGKCVAKAAREQSATLPLTAARQEMRMKRSVANMLAKPSSASLTGQAGTADALMLGRAAAELTARFAAMMQAVWRMFAYHL